MKNLLRDIASQFGKAFAQELMKTNQEQVKLVPSQPTVEIPFLDEEKAITELPVSDPFTEEDYLRFIERFPKYKNYPFEDIRDLKRLILQDKYVKNICLLEKLIHLEWLDLCKNKIEDISVLQNLINLKILWLFKNKISDLTPLRNLKNLKELLLHSNEITDLSQLTNLTDLNILTLSKNNITDISPLKKLFNLKELNLSDNPITQQQIDELQKTLPNCKISFRKY